MKRILLTGPEVREVLETGRVTIRKAILPAPMMVTDNSVEPWSGEPSVLMQLLSENKRGPSLGQPGDKVWVAEDWAWSGFASMPPMPQYLAFIKYADTMTQRDTKKSRATMPQWASRLTLEIVTVRVERTDKWEWVYEMKRVEQGESE